MSPKGVPWFPDSRDRQSSRELAAKGRSASGAGSLPTTWPTLSRWMGPQPPPITAIPVSTCLSTVPSAKKQGFCVSTTIGSK